MAQNSGTRAGTFHGEMDRCRESQGWTTACNRMSERDGKDQGEDSPKQAGSCWFARPCRLATSGAFADAMWCYLCFVLLRFRLYAFVEAAALRSTVLRCAGAPIATHTCFFLFSFLLIWRCRVFRVFFVPLPFSLCMESTSYVLSSRLVFFYLVKRGWNFDISLICENLINQSIIAVRTFRRRESFSIPSKVEGWYR